MVSAKLFENLEKKDGKLLDDVRFREQFQLDPDYPPRKKSFFHIKWLSLISILLVSLALVCYLGSKIQKSTPEASPNKPTYEEFHNEFRKDQPVSLVRTAIFMNKLKIDEMNRGNTGVKYSINQFADWTPQEIMGLFMQEPLSDLTLNITETPDIEFQNGPPASFDWRAKSMVTRIKNQGNCGSCWAFSAVASVESQYAIKRGKLWELSEQELLDCDVHSKGCDGGYVQSSLLFAKDRGLEAELDYPYAGFQHNTCAFQVSKMRVKVDKVWVLPADEDFIANWVANKGPVSFVMPVPQQIMYYHSGIFNPNMAICRDQAVGVHVMTIVGFGIERNQKYWIVKNSWATTWGENGYLRMARGVNICGFKNYVFAPEIL